MDTGFKGVEEAKARLAAARFSPLSTAKNLTAQIGGALLDGVDALRDTGATLSNLLRNSMTIASTTSIPKSTTPMRRATRRSVAA